MHSGMVHAVDKKDSPEGLPLAKHLLTDRPACAYEQCLVTWSSFGDLVGLQFILACRHAQGQCCKLTCIGFS